MKKPLLILTAILLSGVCYRFLPEAPPVVLREVSAPEAAVRSGGTPEASGVPAAVRADFGGTLPRPEPAWPPLHAYRDWESRYLAASPEGRGALAAEGAVLAKARRPEFQKLIRTNPQLALEIAVRPVVRQDLPPEVVSELEKPVSSRGNFNAYFGRPRPGVELPPDQELVLRYFETPEGTSYKANVYGSMLAEVSRKDVALRGVAIERDLAVHESPVRQLEAGERVAAGTAVDETCPVSSITTETKTGAPLVIEPEMPVVELAGRLIRLCNGTHVRVFAEAQRMASGGPGGAGYFYDNYPGTSSEAIGNFRCLYIRVTYPDQQRAPNTEASAYSDMRNVSRFYLESSYGKLTTTSVVTPLIVMPHTKAWYIARDSEVDGLGLVHSDARAEARKLGYDNSQFNCTIVRVNEGPRLSGISWGGGDSVWVSWDGMDVLNHECGHSLGRNHANFWKTLDGSAIGVGENQEYGNSYDVMGGGSGFGAHYNSYSKRSLGWLQDAYVHRPGTAQSYNGIYRIYAYDQPRLEEGQRYSLRVDKDVQRRFYLEYHPAIGGNWPNQLLLMMSGLGSNAGHLVDTTPGSAGGKGDGGIQIGRTFSDFESDLHFTVMGKNGTVPESLDVAVMRGPFPGNLPPVVNLTATASSVAVNGSVTFTAAASDPNGDALVYHWDFSDGYLAPSAPVITRSFTAADQQTVELTVSDLKGGSVRAHTVLTIGSPGRAVIRGTVTSGGLPLAGVRITSDTDKYCFSDAAGNYAIADLQTGSRTLTATLTGYAFTPVFVNPVTVTAAGLTGQNWTAASVAEVSLTASGGAEGGANGTFTLRRTGSTAAALVVTVAPAGGSAVKTSDYTLSPDYAASGTMNTFTIPAGQEALEITVAPVNDTLQEGPETVTLQLAAGDGYQVRTSGVAILTIADNDTTRPVVTLAATDIYATEAAGDTGAFLLSRTGSTAAALTVSLTAGGTASAGADYPAAGAALTIPAGQASVSFTVKPVDDSVPETPEDVTLTVAAGAAYVVSPVESSGTVTISDNDLPVIGVTAPDATLNEAGRGTGLVLITRTGSLAAPLKVYYGLGGRALHGTDYVALPGEATFPAGVDTVPVYLTPYDDQHGEGDESITFSLTTFDNTCELGPNYTVDLVIKDNADAPLVAVTANSAAEPSTNGTFTFTAFGSQSGSITVNYTLSGTAAAGADFTMPSGSVTIAGTSSDSKGAQSTVSIPVLNDALPENTETVILTITKSPGYTVYHDGQAVMRLKDDDSEPVAVSTHSSSLAEPSDDSSFYISRAGTSGSLKVGYTMSGTAVNGTDYVMLSGQAVIPDGASGVDVTVTPVDDALVEGTETVVLTLDPGAGYGAEVAQATLYLADSDLAAALPSMGFASAAGTTSEAPDAVTGEYRDIAVTLPSAMPNQVTVEYEMRGGTASGDDIDWSFADAANGNALLSRGVLVFPPGTLTRNIRIRVRNDGVVEGSETAIIDLVNLATGGSGVRLSGSRYRHTLTIADNAAANPVPRVSFLTAATTRQEADGTEPLLVAALDAPSATPVTVNYTVGGTAAAGIDYTLAPGTITFAPGDLFKKLPLVLVADGVAELSETIVVTLSAPSGAQMGGIPAHTVTVADSNVASVNVTAATAAIEEDSSGSLLFTVTRSGGLTGAPLTVGYTVTGTAVPGTDYTALSGSLTFAAGQMSKVINVTPVADVEEEPDETVTLTVHASADYSPGISPEATVTIQDDDAPPVITRVTPAVPAVAIPAGVGLMAEVLATRELPSGSVAVPVAWSQVSGPGPAVFESPANRRTAVTFPANGRYVIRARAQHGVTADEEIAVSVGVPLIAGMQVGTTTAEGSVSQAGTAYTLSGAGSGLSSSGTADGFYFVSRPLSGNFDVKCRITGFTNPGAGPSCRFGLMVRADDTPGAPYLMSLHKADGTHSRNNRLTAGAVAETSAGTTSYTMPRWVRIVRSGNDFAAWYSADGVTWTQRGSTKSIPDMGAAPLVGLAITSAVPETASTAVFDSLNFSLAGNTGPRVAAGPALSGAGPWMLDGTVSDDGLPLPAVLTMQWLSVRGPAVAGFTSAAASDTGVTFPAGGNYTLRLTAGDGEVVTFADTTAVIQTPSDAWREAKFGADAGNPAIAGDLVDADRDGLTNLVEYALNSEPRRAVSGHLPFATTSGPVISLTYRINLQATDVQIQVQSSPDMNGWAAAPAVMETLSDDGATRVVRASLPATPGRRFLRLQVDRVSAAGHYGLVR